MRKILILFLCLFSGVVSAQTLWGGYRVDIHNSAKDTVTSTNLHDIATFVRQQTTGRATGQTAANSSVATLTVGAADASYMVSGNILVTTSSAEVFSLFVDWTDEGNTARSVAIPLSRISTGQFTVTTISASGAVPYPSTHFQIRCKASTAITIKTSGTFTGCTYNVEGYIQKI